MQSILHPIIGPRKEVHDLSGRVALVVGGAMGIGYEISRAFALHGARVIMVNRKEDQGTSSIEKIKSESQGKARIEWTPCDMGNLNQVQSVFSDIAKRESRLDLLILSAGINANAYGETSDGYDRIFQVNWLGQFYVVNLLYALLRKTSKIPDAPAPRIVFESSELHRVTMPGTKFASAEEINDPSKDPTQLYARTKLAIILGVKFGLVERVIKPNNDRVWALSVHPGAVNTEMQHQWKDAYPGLLGKLITTTMTAFGRSPEQGSFSALYAATSPEIEEKGWNGYYFTDPGQPGKESGQASDVELGSALWNLSHEMVREKVGQDGMVDWNLKV
ncbi:short chain dehydrogenase/reductase family protein [Aspergillus undulatus]|uniref:short chain dehydrogenase/reductase family protein n=1 Tax=Aspergillus undulatus TaxID=1810928 RepID=UPI003CCD22B7